MTETSHCPGALGAACNLLNTMNRESDCDGSNSETLVVAVVNSNFFLKLVKE
jgi:hypothetical protein